MFERFHHNARAAVAHAQQEAERSGHREVGTGHLLLGLLARPGHARDALKAAGADEAKLRAQLPAEAAQPEPDADPARAASADAGAAPAAAAAVAAEPADQGATGQRATPAEPASRDVTDDMMLTRDARRALELAGRAAQRLRHPQVTSGHVLLGVIDQPGPHVQALTVAGIHVGTLRADVLRRLAEQD